MSEVITWETCPTCRRYAALGWLDGFPVEFDCPGGCRLSMNQLRAFAIRRRPAVRWLASSG